MTGAGVVRGVRNRFHPLYHARRISVIRAALSGVDIPVWVRLEGIEWPVRVRAIRHASYLIRSAAVEREMASLACAIVDVLQIGHFCDVGANFGYYSWLLKSRSPELEVDLIEPEVENLHLIDATLGRTPLTGITVHDVAASDVTGTAVFQRDVVAGTTGTLELGGESFASRHWRKSATSQISTKRLDSLFLTKRVDLLKIDVEGHEEQVLVGAAAVLERDAPILIFECFRGTQAARVMLKPFAYELYDAETFAEPTAATTNFLALPARLRPRTPELREAWWHNTNA